MNSVISDQMRFLTHNENRISKLDKIRSKYKKLLKNPLLKLLDKFTFGAALKAARKGKRIATVRITALELNSKFRTQMMQHLNLG